MYIALLFFPDIIGHCCLGMGFDSRAKDDGIRRTETASVRVPWNTTCLEINDRAREVINTLMALSVQILRRPQRDLDDGIEDYQFKCYSCPNKNMCITGRPQFLRLKFTGGDFVKYILVEHHEKTTPLEDYVKLVHADTFWADDCFILETVLDGGVFLSPHCTDLSCESYYRGYDSMVEHLRDEYLSSLNFAKRR